MRPDIKPAAVSCWFKPIKNFNEFMATSKKHGIDVQNADGSDWGGLDWREIQWWRKTDAQFRFIRDHPEFTHFMFTDSYDIVFAAGWEEIVAKYLAYQSPIVFGTESYCWPKQEQAVLYPATDYRSKYLNAGFWMGERAAALPFMEEAARRAAKKEQCDSGIFVDLFLSKQFPIVLDNKCSLLFCMNNGSHTLLEKRDGRPACVDTGEKPCIGHGNGASPLNVFISMLE